MSQFESLLEIADILNSEDGCPWDRKQTFQSLRSYLLEETHEVLEAVDNDDADQMIEELGDLLYTIVFYAKIAEREKRFTLSEILETIKAKMIRRHPHVFGEEKAHSMEEVIEKWERIKTLENKEKKRKSILDGIPKTLSSLHRAQKVFSRIEKEPSEKEKALVSDKILAKQILDIVRRANHNNIDLESALRVLLHAEEEKFRAGEARTP